MKKFTVSDLKIKTGECLDIAKNEAVEIDKNGKPVAVLIPYEEYNRLAKIEDEYWLARAEAAEKYGFAGAKATSNFFKATLLANRRGRRNRLADLRQPQTQ